MKSKKAIISNIIYPAMGLAIIILAWYVIAKIIDVELIVPSFRSTFASLGQILTTKGFFSIVGGTLKRTALSFAISFIAAVFMALVSYFVPMIYKLFLPIITVIRTIPTMSVILLTIIWLKPDNSPLFVAFLIIFPIMYSGFYTSISNVDDRLIQVCKVYKVSGVDRIFKVFLPQIAPNFFDTIKNCLSMTVKLIVSAEVLAQTKNSMGIMMQTSRLYLESASLLAWTIVAITISALLEVMVFLVKKGCMRWTWK